jgi:SAM-dependent methyltransferase
VLDVGCGPGWLAEALTRQGHEVTGVDLAAAPGVADRMAGFVQADLEQGLPDTVGGGFDVVVAADVIEHVRAPEQLLGAMAERLRPGGTILASVPNFAHWYPRARTALGLFDYDQRGILDATHLRFFTRRSFRRMLATCGLRSTASHHTGLPFDALGIDTTSLPGRLVAAVDRMLVRVWPTMFAYQFVHELALDPALDVANRPAA